MKTNLQKILSVSGHPGLFRYLSQSKGGVIVESLLDKKRAWMGPSARMTSLSDISIYSVSDELHMQQVLEMMRDYLKGEAAPSPKSKPEELKEFFEKVVPDYDKDRFYPSHMKKVVEWFNVLRDNEALDFEEPEASPEAEPKAETESKAAEKEA